MLDLIKQPSHKPLPNDFRKPGELIDVVEITPLSLADRRTLNLLIANTGEDLTEIKTHSIQKSDLRSPGNESNAALAKSLDKLSSVFVKIRTTIDGEPAVRRTPILHGSIEHDKADGLYYYQFSPALVHLIRDSNQWGKLKRDIMFSFSSKYALALYETVQKRGELKYKNSEDFTIDQMRVILDVEKGKLEKFANLNAWAIKPAVEEVNALADYTVSIEPVKQGRAVEKLRMSWAKKNAEERQKAWKEIRSTKIGRKARIRKQVEIIS